MQLLWKIVTWTVNPNVTTLIDLHNYAAMAIMLMDESELP